MLRSGTPAWARRSARLDRGVALRDLVSDHEQRAVMLADQLGIGDERQRRRRTCARERAVTFGHENVPLSRATLSGVFGRMAEGEEGQARVVRPNEGLGEANLLGQYVEKAARRIDAKQLAAAMDA